MKITKIIVYICVGVQVTVHRGDNARTYDIISEESMNRIDRVIDTYHASYLAHNLIYSLIEITPERI